MNSHIDEFTLLSASWVIRARWREIQRFLRKFQKMKCIHDKQFWVFYFPKQKICNQKCGKLDLERMAILEIIVLKRVSAIHFLYFQRHTITENVWRQKKEIFMNFKERIPSLVHLSCKHELICLVYEGERPNVSFYESLGYFLYW